MMPLPLLFAASLVATPPSTAAAMRWEKRVLVIGAPDADDPALHDQRRILARWREGAAQRDLVFVEIVGDAVSGASDTAAALRRRLAMPAGRFAVALIGKDGGTKLRGDRPLSSATLAATIDAMPMRVRGGR